MSVATVTKLHMGFDDRTDVCVSPKFLLPNNFHMKSINAHDGPATCGVTGDYFTNSGTVRLNVCLGDTWFSIKFLVVDNVLSYPLIGNNFRTNSEMLQHGLGQMEFCVKPTEVLVPLYEPPVVLRAKRKTSIPRQMTVRVAVSGGETLRKDMVC